MLEHLAVRPGHYEWSVMRAGIGAGVVGSMTGSPLTRTPPDVTQCLARSSLIPAAINRSSTVAGTVEVS